MNIVYSSDECYAQHLCVSIVSLLENNQDCSDINIFVISNAIPSRIRQKLDTTVQNYGRTLFWIDFHEYKARLQLNMEWTISISSYARLFIAEILPEDCKRALYLDCDTIILGSLSELYLTNMNGCAVAGVEDLILPQYKQKVGLSLDQHYINAGVLLIDLNLWRKNRLSEVFLNYIAIHHGQVTHHDQGVINGTLSDHCLILHPRYNVLTPFFMRKYSRLLRFYELDKYYKKDQIHSAVEDPVIIHFTPEYVGRVWEYGCKHPKAKLYIEYLEKTPWKGSLYVSTHISRKRQLLYLIEAYMPMTIIQAIRKLTK